MPINPRSTIQSAMAALGAGQATKAESLYLALKSDYPELFDTHMLGGVIAANLGRRDAAIDRFRTGLDIDGQSFDAHNWLSVMLRETGQSADALRHAQAANTLRPGSPDALCNLGLCLFDAGAIADSIAVFEQAVRLRPGDAMLRTGLAKGYEAAGRNLDALREFRTAIQISPDHIGYLKLGDLLSTLGRHQEAVDAYSHAIRLKPDSASTYVSISRTLSDLLQHDEAAKCLAKAESIDPLLIDIFLRKAHVLQMKGEFSDAEAEFKRVIEIRPSQGAAYYGIVSAKRITDADHHLVEQMEGALKADNLTSDDRSNLHYALGKAFDNLGEYKRAMDEYDLANLETWKAALSTHPFSTSQTETDNDTRIRIFSRKFFDDLPVVSASDSPIFIVGMPRSGTTLVEQILSCHPTVEAAGEQSFWISSESKIVNFAKASFDQQLLQMAAQEYLALIRELSHGKPHVTDKNPANFLALGVIHAAFPNARIIHTRRNSVDTALSIYMTPMRTPPDFACVKENIVFFTRQYQRLMAHWQLTMPSDRYIEVDYEDLVSNGEHSVRRLLEFAELEWSDACLHPENNLRAVRTPSFWQVRQPLYTSSIQRWKKYEPYLGAFAQLV